MTIYGLVAGAWLGGWAWQPVAGQLRVQGHDFHPVMLTGLGAGPHLATPQVRLDAFIADVVSLVLDGVQPLLSTARALRIRLGWQEPSPGILAPRTAGPDDSCRPPGPSGANLLERTSRETAGRRRSPAASPGERSCLRLLWALLDAPAAAGAVPLHRSRHPPAPRPAPRPVRTTRRPRHHPARRLTCPPEAAPAHFSTTSGTRRSVTPHEVKPVMRCRRPVHRPGEPPQRSRAPAFLLAGGLVASIPST
jgi:hypothetical protein